MQFPLENKCYKTLINILSWERWNWDIGAPEIRLDGDGDLCLDWVLHENDIASVIIHPNGNISWSVTSPKSCGTNLDEFRKIMCPK